MLQKSKEQGRVWATPGVAGGEVEYREAADKGVPLAIVGGGVLALSKCFGLPSLGLHSVLVGSPASLLRRRCHCVYEYL